jgi:anti-sigma factor RsiW
VQDLLSEAIDGTLPASQAQRFQDHLAACPPCRLLFADVKDSLGLLTALPAIEVSAGFDDAVRARLRREQASIRPTLADRFARWREAGAWLRWAPLGAAAALLVWVAMSRDTFGPGVPAEVARVAGDADAVDEFTATSDPAASALTPVDFAAPMPQAVEVYLESGRELRLNPDRYRRSNYHYPLRAVRDPLGGPVVPVSGGVVQEVPAAVDPGVPVLTF